MLDPKFAELFKKVAARSVAARTFKKIAQDETNYMSFAAGGDPNAPNVTYQAKWPTEKPCPSCGATSCLAFAVREERGSTLSDTNEKFFGSDKCRGHDYKAWAVYDCPKCYMSSADSNEA